MRVASPRVAISAKYYHVPFYVAAPSTTFDLSIASGKQIPIEERTSEEITRGFGNQTAPTGARTYNPAFDVTPAELITGIITERGVFNPGEAGATLPATL